MRSAHTGRLTHFEAGKKRKSTTLLFETFWKLKWPIFAAFPARLITMGLTFAQPFLLADTVGLSALPVVKETDQWGYGLIGAFILVYLGLAVRNIHPIRRLLCALANVPLCKCRSRLANTSTRWCAW